MIEARDVEEAAERLVGIIRQTPTFTSPTLSAIAGRLVSVKPEHFQRTGSFKIRGAYNCVSQLVDLSGVDRVVAASAGNHGQGVSLAASLCGIRSTIVMPSAASLPKVTATRGYGAEVVLAGETVDDAIAEALRIAAEEGAAYVPPFDDLKVIAGQGTVGLEIASEVPESSTVVVPIGGGGLISGVSAAVKARSSKARVIGVQASGSAAMVEALRRGAPAELNGIDTMADGIAVRSVAQLTLDHVKNFVDDVVTVNDEEISRAVLLLLERCKWLVEPAGAVGLAALLAKRIPGEDPVVLVLSGGNVDPLLLTRIVEHGLTAAGRYFMLRVVLPDKPGALAGLTDALARMSLNLVTVDHRRFGATVGVNETEVIATVETRDPEHCGRIIPTLLALGFRADSYH